jgi:hypothetical protein
VSVKPTPVSATALDAGLVTVKLSPVVAPREMLDGLKEVVRLGGDAIAAADGARARPPNRASRRGDKRGIPGSLRNQDLPGSYFVRCLTLQLCKCTKYISQLVYV